MAAKRNPQRRFHALYHQLCRADVLAEAWRRVKSNGGAAGIDGETLSAIERRGVEEFLADLRDRLGTGKYRPAPNASEKFNAIDRYVRERLVQLLVKRGGQRRRPVNPMEWPHNRFVKEHGLHKLLGTIRFPGGAKAS